MAAVYDPEWIAFESSFPGGKMPELPAERAARVESFNKALLGFASALPATDTAITTREEQINSDVKVRVYHPSGHHSNSATGLPLLLWLHGGGLISGDLDTEDHLCRTVCSGVNAIVVSVDYRLLPSVHFPAPIDDAYNAYLWARRNASTLGADIDRFAVWGGSAGGTIAIALVYRLVKQKIPVAGLVVNSPLSLYADVCPAEYKAHYTSYVEHGGQDVPVVQASLVPETLAIIASDPEGWKTPEFFPSMAGKAGVEGFPRTYITNTEIECFRDDGTVLELELKDAGVEVKRDVLKGFPHYFWCFPIQEGGKVFRHELVEGIKWVFAAEKEVR